MINFKLRFTFSKPILNQPFEAELEVVVRPTETGCEPGQSPITGKVYRDSRGRRREEYCFRGSTSVVISDLAVGTTWAVDDESRTILVLHHQPATLHAAQGAKPSQPPGIDRLQDYEGLKYLSDNHKSEDGTWTEIRWSVELLERLIQKQVGPEGETTYRLFNIKRTEPEPNLFVIPEGYKIVECEQSRGPGSEHLTFGGGL